MALIHKKLKRGIFTNPEGNFEIERYVIENETDLNAFVKKYPQMKTMGMHSNWLRDLTLGRIILATDAHPLSGFPTYQFEEVNGDQHPGNLIRKRLCTEQSK